MRIVRLTTDIIVSDIGEMVAFAPGAFFYIVRDVNPTLWILQDLTKKYEFYADPADFCEVDLDRPLSENTQP